MLAASVHDRTWLELIPVMTFTQAELDCIGSVRTTQSGLCYLWLSPPLRDMVLPSCGLGLDPLPVLASPSPW